MPGRRVVGCWPGPPAARTLVHGLGTQRGCLVLGQVAALGPMQLLHIAASITAATAAAIVGTRTVVGPQHSAIAEAEAVATSFIVANLPMQRPSEAVAGLSCSGQHSD